MLATLLRSGTPIYFEAPDEMAPVEQEGFEFSRHLMARPRHLAAPAASSSRDKRGKLMRLSLTDNIDVLREKLFMEIARRRRLENQSQVKKFIIPKRAFDRLIAVIL